MADFESKRLEIYEDYISELGTEVDTSHGDFVYPSFTQSAAVEDGYREADFLIEITVANSVDRTLILMASKIEDNQRILLDNIEDDSAVARARKYASEIENGAYFGLTDGEKAYVVALDPDVRFEKASSLEELPEIVDDIIQEERRIKDSREFVDELREFHEELSPYIQNNLREKIEGNPEFEEKIRIFLTPIGMVYEEDERIPDATVEMLSQQATYLLIDKILFYYLILENEKSLKDSLEDTEKYDEVFDQLKNDPPSPSEGVNEKWASAFWNDLEQKFSLIQQIDYEPIFDSEKSPLNEITLSTDGAGCFVVNELMDYLYRKEELSNLFDGPLLARIYEGLIPPETRWKWGQIYTPPEVTRLITKWVVKNPEDEVLDPACGTGRFLVSAYEELAALKGADIGERHQEIVDQIYGIDINQFPAHLATMSLVAMNLSAITEEVNIDVKDFFLFKGGSQSSFSPKKSRVSLVGQTEFSEEGELEGQGKLTFDKPIGNVDAIVMNPPYTRQEALGGTYKENVRDVALAGLGENGKSLSMDRQAAFYVYFMTHATKFLRKDNGRFGMIIQNSWMDALYGQDVQDFLLDNYRIEAIIGTQQDRIIKTADVNTVILLLEREEDATVRDQNHVKFVQLKRSPGWFEKNYGFDQLFELADANMEYIDEDLRIISRTQDELYDEDKWGRFIRAPDVYFRKISDLLTKELHDIADVSLGLTSGYNSFFYLNQEEIDEWNIEDQYLRPLIKSPRECQKYRIDPDDLSRYVLDVQEDKSELEGTNAFEYIKYGESEDIHKRPFFANMSSADWYKKSMHNAPLLQPYNVNERHFTCINEMDACVDKRLVCIDTKSDIPPDFVFSYLNSTLGILVKELFGRVSLGEGALDNSVTDSQVMPVLDPESINEETLEKIKNAAEGLKERDIRDIYGELGASDVDEVSVDQVEENRREIDRIFMEDILNLSKKEQYEIYRGAIQLVKDRIAKARSA